MNLLAALLIIACEVNSTFASLLPNETDHVKEREWTIDEILNSTNSAAEKGASMALSSPGIRRIELDILIPDQEWESRMNSLNNNKSRIRRNTNEISLWPNAIIPFTIEDRFKDNEIEIVRLAMEDFKKYTCVQFRDAKESDSDFVKVVYGSECSSYVGRQGGTQILELGEGCFKRKTMVILHELAHAVGLQHEHNRPDRDHYVIINWDNIEKKYQQDFEIVKNAEPYVGIPYSYLSLMHYGKKTAGRHDKQTIQTKNKKYQDRIGNTISLNFEDAKLINSMYSCSAQCTKTLCPSEGFVGKDCDCLCPSTQLNASIMKCDDYIKICTGSFYVLEKPQYLRSPGYPIKYPPRISCAWTLLTQSGSGSISLQITKLSTEECCDHVVIFDNTGNEKVISGAHINVTLIFGHRVSISFTSDDFLEDAGFEITFKALPTNVTTIVPVMHSKNHETFGAASFSFQVPQSSVEVAVTHQGTLLMKTLHGNLLEYLPNGRLIDRWIPLKQSMSTIEEVQDIVTLRNGNMAVSLFNSQLVLFLTKSIDNNIFAGEWIGHPAFMELQSKPWRLSTFEDTIAVAEKRLSETYKWLFGRQINIWNFTSGEKQHVWTREYDIYGLALTSETVVTSSFHKLKSDNGNETYVVDAHSLRNDQRIWRYEVQEFVEDMCTDFTGRTLYAAVRPNDGSNGRVAAIDMADGKEIRHNILNGASLQQPIALSIGRVLGLKESALVVLGLDPSSKHLKRVTVHQRNAL